MRKTRVGAAAGIVAAAVTGGRLGDIALGGPAASDGGSYKNE